jgi:hypothetical protein
MQWGAVCAQAEVHAYLPKRWLRPVGATESVPPGNRKAKVAIGLDQACRVVDTVHVGGDHQPAQPAVVVLWQYHLSPRGTTNICDSPRAVDNISLDRINVMPFTAAMALYPGCLLRRMRANAPLLILIGAEDDWTLASRCTDMVSQSEQWGTSRLTASR